MAKFFSFFFVIKPIISHFSFIIFHLKFVPLHLFSVCIAE